MRGPEGQAGQGNPGETGLKNITSLLLTIVPFDKDQSRQHLCSFLFLCQADRDNLQKQIDTNAANGDKSSDELREMIRHAIIFVIV